MTKIEEFCAHDSLHHLNILSVLLLFNSLDQMKSKLNRLINLAFVNSCNEFCLLDIGHIEVLQLDEAVERQDWNRP